MAKNVSFHDYTVQQAITAADASNWVYWRRSYRRVDYSIANHYHPFTDTLIEKLNVDGLPALLDATYQASLTAPLAPTVYVPGSNASGTFPDHEIDVSDAGAYSIYNWEMFFHAPVLIATHLSKNQRFEEAQRWFHFVFDPTTTDTSTPAPARFWKFLRFRQETTPDQIAKLLTELAEGTDSELVSRMETAIQAWRDKPFQPHVIARGRALAYQTNVVMKYLDNLIAWGDFLFRQDTIETMNEATQIYVLAANILGPKPQEVPPRGTPPRMSYAQLKAKGIDAFGNALVEMENAFPFDIGTFGDDPGDPGTGSAFGIGRSLYFCIPNNDQLLMYWDQVGDRLFKLRHCLNIEGVFRIPALFDPPIDPGALVRAVAAGLDIASIVNNVNQPVSIVRGQLLLQKAEELCNEVKALGNAALSAIERGEAEHLGALRQAHELAILQLGSDLRFLQWKEAEAATEALAASRATVFERYRHYKRILGITDADIETHRSIDLMRSDLTAQTFDAAYRDLVAYYGASLGREDYRKETSVGGLMEFAGNAVVSVVGGQLGQTLPLNKNENAELNIFLPTADAFSLAATIFKVATPLLALIPQFGAAAKPFGVGAEVGFGGVQLSKAAKYGGEGAEMIANAFKGSADRASKMAGYYRRAEDYVLQANLASAELEQYGRQILSSLLREQIAKKEYEQQLKQIDNAELVDTYLHEKFTNEQLYVWMQGQLSELHYDCYKQAFDVAKRAEQTIKYEAMRPELDSQQFIKFGYWDAGHKGLLAGETLSVDLKRLELAYVEQNRREYELTKHVSLARLDPLALLKLKATGACEVEVPEWLFDLDSPGQYFRRLRTVALSIPCVTGPYTSVHCKLSLLHSSIRISSMSGQPYGRADSGDDDRFRDFAGAIESTVTSSAQNDSGLFEVNLRDDRRLPFEGAGAISRWRLELPGDIPQFDVETVSDVVLHLRYTAREAGNLRADAVQFVHDNVLQAPDTLVRLFSLNHDFSDAWRPFVTAPDDAHRAMTLNVTTDYFPYWVNTLGMDDAITATFAIIDAAKHKLSVAPAALAFAGDAQNGWTLVIDQTSPVFAFFKKYLTKTIYMTITYQGA
jgi:hypothetical protein